MAWKSNAHRYGAVAMAMHWVTAVAILGLLVSGLTMADMAGADPAKQSIVRTHVIIGALVVLLTLLRLAWWLLADRKPDEPGGQPRWQALAARAVHGLFYVVIVVMGASGIATILLSGAGDILFSGAPGPLPDFMRYPPRLAHGLFAWTLMALIGLHVAAALYHQFVLRDRLLSRMGLGRAA
ncbi:MAG: cytochrome b [Rhizobiales bacterium]|nr:cytochrome b [Hyphomicrobiales bacterium]OJU35774.1 MAG: hypothetical protein BGN94_24060 [Rhizobiales bacterium 68-8]